MLIFYQCLQYWEFLHELYYSIKVSVERWPTATYDIALLMVFQLVRIILQTTFFKDFSQKRVFNSVLVINALHLSWVLYFSQRHYLPLVVSSCNVRNNLCWMTTTESNIVFCCRHIVCFSYFWTPNEGWNLIKVDIHERIFVTNLNRQLLGDFGPFLARDAFVRTNRHAIAMMFVRLSGTDVHCDHTVHASGYLIL